MDSQVEPTRSGPDEVGRTVSGFARPFGMAGDVGEVSEHFAGGRVDTGTSDGLHGNSFVRCAVLLTAM